MIDTTESWELRLIELDIELDVECSVPTCVTLRGDTGVELLGEDADFVLGGL
jgi:hypothetical protein